MSAETDEFEVSQEQDPWGRAPYWLMSKVQPSAFVTYVALSRYVGMRDGCRPSIAQLADDTTLSRATVKRCIAALVSVGAVKIEPRFLEGSRLPNRYYLRTSEPTSPQVTGDPTPRSPVNPPRLISDPTPGSPVSHELERERKKERTKEPPYPPRGRSRDENQEPTIPRLPSPANVPPPDLFDQFWQAYPRRDGKDTARKAWTKRMREKVPAADIIAAATRQASLWRKARTERQFIPMPASWLNGGRFTDEALTSPDTDPRDVLHGPPTEVARAGIDAVQAWYESRATRRAVETDPVAEWYERKARESVTQ